MGRGSSKLGGGGGGGNANAPRTTPLEARAVSKVLAHIERMNNGARGYNLSRIDTDASTIDANSNIGDVLSVSWPDTTISFTKVGPDSWQYESFGMTRVADTASALQSLSAYSRSNGKLTFRTR